MPYELRDPGQRAYMTHNPVHNPNPNPDCRLQSLLDGAIEAARLKFGLQSYT